jgi:hypothetical protein
MRRDAVLTGVGGADRQEEHLPLPRGEPAFRQQILKMAVSLDGRRRFCELTQEIGNESVFCLRPAERFARRLGRGLFVVDWERGFGVGFDAFHGV